MLDLVGYLSRCPLPLLHHALATSPHIALDHSSFFIPLVRYAQHRYNSIPVTVFLTHHSMSFIIVHMWFVFGMSE